MKRITTTLLALSALAAGVRADSLYYIGSEAQKSMPLKWVVGLDFTYDDNVNPTVVLPGAPGYHDETFSTNPYVGVSFVNITPQTTWDVYARLGVVYYFDQPAGMGTDDMYEQYRVGVNLTHRFSERLRFSSRNFVAYELEPDYAYGFANTRMTDPYLFWSTDNSIGFRWSERFATYTGISLTGLDYSGGVPNQDRFTLTAYNQFRYQASPQTVLTLDYRYASTTGDGYASDSTNQYLLLGVEHRFTPNTIGVLRVGANMQEVDNTGSSSNTAPYLEAALHSQVNEQFSVRAFARYGYEVYDTAFGPGYIPGILVPVEFDEHTVLRIGVSGEYALSPMLSLFGGIDYINGSYDSPHNAITRMPVAGVSPTEDMINLYLGLSYKVTDYLYASLSYNYTDSSSDIRGRDYDRNRVTVGLRAEF